MSPFNWAGWVSEILPRHSFLCKNMDGMCSVRSPAGPVSEISVFVTEMSVTWAIACSRLSVVGDERRKNEGGLRRGAAGEPVRISSTTLFWYSRNCYTLWLVNFDSTVNAPADLVNQKDGERGLPRLSPPSFLTHSLRSNGWVFAERENRVSKNLRRRIWRR